MYGDSAFFVNANHSAAVKNQTEPAAAAVKKDATALAKMDLELATVAEKTRKTALAKNQKIKVLAAVASYSLG